MTMDKYAIIKDGLVINYIEYESQPSNPPPGFEEGVIAILNNNIGLGYTYKDGIFTPPQPYPSWVLINNIWESPVPRPNDGKWYVWDEPTLSWKER